MPPQSDAAMKILPYLVSTAIILAGLQAASWALGPELAPPPVDSLAALGRLAMSGELFRELGITVVRAVLGLLLANVVGIALGVLAGLIPGVLRLLAPLVAAIQSCPPIVWISLVMVWAGTGSAVPVATVFAATVPFAFSTTAQGVMSLDRRLLSMSALFDVPWKKRVRLLIIPGVLSHWLGAFSSLLANGWKAAAVAEFMGSHSGVGAMIFWSYRKLEMDALNAWALALIILGVALECAVVAPLRRKTARMSHMGADMPKGAFEGGN